MYVSCYISTIRETHQPREGSTLNDDAVAAPLIGHSTKKKCQRSEIDQHKRGKPERCKRAASRTFHIELGGIAVSVSLCARCSIALEREQADRIAGKQPSVPNQRRSERVRNTARKAAKHPTIQRKISSRAELPAHIRLARIENGRREMDKLHSTWRDEDFEEALMQELAKEAREDDPEWIGEELEACGVNPHLLTEEYQEAQAILRSQGIRYL